MKDLFLNDFLLYKFLSRTRQKIVSRISLAWITHVLFLYFKNLLATNFLLPQIQELRNYLVES